MVELCRLVSLSSTKHFLWHQFIKDNLNDACWLDPEINSTSFFSISASRLSAGEGWDAYESRFMQTIEKSSKRTGERLVHAGVDDVEQTDHQEEDHHLNPQRHQTLLNLLPLQCSGTQQRHFRIFKLHRTACSSLYRPSLCSTACKKRH